MQKFKQFLLSISLVLLTTTISFSQCVEPQPPTAPDAACYNFVIQDDPFCCNFGWDAICQASYDDCAQGGGGGGCIVPQPATAPNNACYQAVIANDPFCCNTMWDGGCQLAYDNCAGSGGGGGTGGCNIGASICNPNEVAGPFTFVPKGPAPGHSCLLWNTGTEAAFIILYITETGPLNILIEGNNPAGNCIDVSIFNIPDGQDPCDAIYNPVNEIGCNLIAPCEGCAEFSDGVYSAGCPAQVPAPTVQAGDVIMIVVHDYSDAQNTFTMQLAPPGQGAQTGPPNPTITQVGPFCTTDGAVQLDAVNNGGDWTGPGVSATGLFDPALAGPGTHTINYSIGTAPCNATASTQIIVSPTPTVTGGSDLTICEGESATLTITGDAGVTYTWSPATGLNTTTGNTVIASPTTTTTYTVTASVGGCSGSDQIVINVLPAGHPDCASDCIITNFEANLDLPNCSVEYITTGIIEFEQAPASGNLIVEDCQGNQVVAATAPFTSPVNYTLTGTDADGQPCFFRAFFSDLSTCDSQLDYQFPAAEAPDEAGTVTVITDGDGINEYVLCDGDIIGIFTNLDYEIEPINPGDVVGIAYGLYSCPPQPGGVGIDPSDDPCLIGFFLEEDLAFLNDGGDNAAIFTLFPNLPPNNTFYLVPLSLVDAVNGFYQEDCYDLAIDQMVTIQMLNPISTVLDQNCATGEATITLTGGYPQFSPTTYIASNVSPVNASVTTNNVSHGGTIVIGGLLDGQAWSVDIQDENGCPITVTGTFSGGGDASFTYSQASYCDNLPNPTPVITGNQGGQFTSTTGLVINATTGQIDLLASDAGTYTVTYATPNPDCPASETFEITIIETPTVQVSNVTVCANETINEIVFVTNPAGATIDWTNSNTTIGLGASGTGNIAAFQGINTGNNAEVGTVIVTPSNATCTGTPQTFTISVIPDYTIDNPQTLCDGESYAINGNTYTEAGVYTDVFQSIAGCDSTVITTITLNSSVITNNPQIICEGDSYTINGNVYSVTGIYNDVFVSANGCDSTVVTDLTVNPVFTVNNPQVICQGESYVINGNTYTTTGIYTDVFQSISGCDSTVITDLTVHPLPNPVLTGGDEYCVGSSITVGTSNPFTSYSWSNGSTNTTINVTTSDNPISVTVTDANGCSATSAPLVVNEVAFITFNSTIEICPGSTAIIHGLPQTVAGVYSQTFPSTFGCDSLSNVTLVVLPQPTVNAGPDVSVCVGAEVQLTATGNAVSYVWSNGILNTAAFFPNSTINLTVTGTDANGCTNTDDLLITVNDIPTIAANASQLIVCQGDQVTLTGGGGVNYTWTNNVINNVPFTPLQTTTYTVTGIDANGCSNTAQITVTVNPLPAINAGPDQSICPGDFVTLTATGGIDYLWDNNVVNGVPFQPTATTTYTVGGVDANGCINIDQVVVVVNDAAAINAGQDVVVCAGNPVILNATGGSNYTWTGGIQNNVPFNPIQTTTYTVTGTTPAGCVGTDDVLVTVEPIPVVSFNIDNPSGCSPLQVTFTNTSQSTGVICQWNFGNGSVFNDCNSATTVYTAPGCYDVTFTSTSAAGCTGTVTLVNAVCVAPDPIAEFIPIPSVLSGANPTTTMVNSSQNAVSYVWSFGDGTALSQDVNPSHTYIVGDSDSYEIMLIAINEFGCVDTAYQVIRFEEDLIYYVPNTFTPDGDQYNQEFKPVFTSGFDPFDYNLKIYNRWGELIFESNDAEVGWNGSYGNIADRVQDGTYVWKIEFKLSKNDARKTIVGHVTLIR
jgi:gliding motility-associated-like protein